MIILVLNRLSLSMSVFSLSFFLISSTSSAEISEQFVPLPIFESLVRVFYAFSAQFLSSRFSLSRLLHIIDTT